MYHYRKRLSYTKPDPGCNLAIPWDIFDGGHGLAGTPKLCFQIFQIYTIESQFCG